MTELGYKNLFTLYTLTCGWRNLIINKIIIVIGVLPWPISQPFVKVCSHVMWNSLRQCLDNPLITADGEVIARTRRITVAAGTEFGKMYRISMAIYVRGTYRQTQLFYWLIIVRFTTTCFGLIPGPSSGCITT